MKPSVVFFAIRLFGGALLFIGLSPSSSLALPAPCSSDFEALAPNIPDPVQDRIRDLAHLALDDIQNEKIVSSARAELKAGSEKKVKALAIESGLSISEIERRIRIAKQAILFGPKSQKNASTGAPTVRSEIAQLDLPPTYRFRWSLDSAPGPILSIALRPDGKQILAGLQNGSLCSWDLGSNGEQIGTPIHRQIPKVGDGIFDLAFSPDGNLLVMAGYGGARILESDHGVWKERGGKPLSQSMAVAAAFTPDGKWFASGADNVLQIAPTESEFGSPLFEGARGTWVSSIAFNTDGTLLAGTDDGSAVVFEKISDGNYKRREVFKNEGDDFFTLAFSPDGKFLVSGGITEIDFWQLGRDSNEPVRRLSGHSCHVRSITFEPSGKLLASGSTDHSVRLWNVKTARQHQVLDGHSGAVRSVVFSKDGSFIASGATDKTIRIWGVEREEE